MVGYAIPLLGIGYVGCFAVAVTRLLRVASLRDLVPSLLLVLTQALWFTIPLVFNFWHIAGSFLIGRFLGTFLPSTVGLDSYKLYDAAKFSGHVVPTAAATAVEKVMGLSGIWSVRASALSPRSH